jgi:hypothetical protein
MYKIPFIPKNAPFIEHIKGAFVGKKEILMLSRCTVQR